jgi:hypothetical protein
MLKRKPFANGTPIIGALHKFRKFSTREAICCPAANLPEETHYADPSEGIVDGQIHLRLIGKSVGVFRNGLTIGIFPSVDSIWASPPAATTPAVNPPWVKPKRVLKRVVKSVRYVHSIPSRGDRWKRRLIKLRHCASINLARRRKHYRKSFPQTTNTIAFVPLSYQTVVPNTSKTLASS